LISKESKWEIAHDLDSNIPSDIQTGVDIPSDCTQFSKYPSSFNANRPFDAPLSDITSKTPISSNGIATKKKFKFSPSNSEVSQHSNSVLEAGDSCVSSEKSVKKSSSNSKRDRYNPNDYSSKFQVDSDDDFQ